MKVVHIRLIDPYNGESDFYCGCLKAIYDLIPQERVGITYSSLTNAIRGKSEYRNKKCIIKVRALHQHPQTNKQQPV